MNVLTGYIVKEILKASIIAVLVILSLYNLFTFSDELEDMGKGSYGLKEILFYLALTTPRVFYQLVPSAALLGSLFVLGGMANNRELVAMRASGVSILGIIKPVMYSGAIMVLFSFCIGEFIAPLTERTAQLIRSKAKDKEVMMNTKYGFWLRDENTFINVRQILGDGELADISIYELDEKGALRRISHAKKANFANGKEWLLKSIVHSEMEGGKVTAGEAEEKAWKSALDPDFMDVVMVKPENLSVYDLGKYIEFLRENGQESNTFELAFWDRLVNPVTTMAMLLIAVPFVIRAHRNMSIGYRITVGVIFGMGFFVFDKIIGHIGLVYALNPLLMGILPSLIILAVATAAIRSLR
ncbi:MAG: LPS export ABC transporter permease LptG [Gammaproteobacteria bacterium]